MAILSDNFDPATASKDERKQAQSELAALGIYRSTVDGKWGTLSREAFAAWQGGHAAPVPAGVHRVKASSFADPADLRAFRACKAKGKSDRECFAVGDNCIGLWGDATDADTPMCALPPDDWQPFYHTARGKRVLVKANGRQVVCELRDTMPAKKNIRNGAGIDLNPAAVKALGLKPPIMVAATWQWADNKSS